MSWSPPFSGRIGDPNRSVTTQESSALILRHDVPPPAVSLRDLTTTLIAEDWPPRCDPDYFRAWPGVGEVVFQAGPRSDAERTAAWVGDRDLGEAVEATTDQALLVVLGRYAQPVGLIDRLASVPLDQRTREHTPQTKLIQCLVGVLAGLDYLHDFNDGPPPLVKDQAVIARWKQSAFAHSSGVSRRLEAADEQTWPAVREVLQTVSQPFIEAEVMALVQPGRRREIDVAVTGRRVSPSRTTDPDADFGWLDDEISKG